MTLQKLLEAHIEKAAEKVADAGFHEDAMPFKAGAALTTPLLLAAVEALEKFRTQLENGGAYIVEDGFEEPEQCKQLREITKSLSLIAASLKREGA